VALLWAPLRQSQSHKLTPDAQSVTRVLEFFQDPLGCVPAIRFSRDPVGVRSAWYGDSEV
jgi:hypothetical protein